jgi:hypothetical protein
MGHSPWLIPLGFAVGTLGTLIGAGGGFVLVPALLLLYPDAAPETVTAISLAVVFVNAASGTWAYARTSRIDYRSGLLFAAATVPGAIAAVLTIDLVPRRGFDAIFGIVMIAAAIYLSLHRERVPSEAKAGGKCLISRRMVDAYGIAHSYCFDVRLGVGLSLLVGYISSLLGIGGGIIHVPALIRLLDFPVHIATATSQFILGIMALTGTIAHVASGSFSKGGLLGTVYLGAGALFGAQAGAALAARVRGGLIIRILAVALALVGIRILIMALTR